MPEQEPSPPHPLLSLFSLCYPHGLCNPPDFSVDAGDAGFIPGLGRSLGEGNDNPLQYSCLGNLMDRGPHPLGGSKVLLPLARNSETQIQTQPKCLPEDDSLALVPVGICCICESSPSGDKSLFPCTLITS